LGVSIRRWLESRSVLNLYGELWRQARGSRHLLAAAFALLIGAQVLLLGTPLLAAKAINALQLQGTRGMKEAGLWLVGAVLLAAASWLLHGPGRLLERHVSLRVRKRLSLSLIDRLFALPLGWHEAHHSGATAHRVQQSSHALYAFAQSQFIYLNSAVRLIGPVLALWWIEPVVGLGAILGFALISTSAIGFDRAMIRLAREENDAERRYAATLVDALGNTTTLLALRQARAVLALLERRLLAVFAPLRRSILLNEVKWCTVDLATRVLSCALVTLFAWSITQNSSTAQQTLLLGSLYMVWEYAVQAGGVVASVAQHFQTLARQHADYTSADLVREAQTVPTPPAVMAGAVPGRGWQRLDFCEMSFRHAASRDAGLALDRISLRLVSGKRYALIGDSGCGKSTLLRALAGLYPFDGVLRCDDDLVILSAQETAHFLRTRATLIPQDAEVFGGSLAENLSLCDSVLGTPSPGEYARALQISRADAFIDTSNAGLETEVAERAANWSGGQRSRIALARGVLAAEGSDLILLDEPTAHLDAVTEAEVYSNLFAAFPDACIVSSVHRLQVLGQFDEVLVMQAGRLVAQGPVAELALTCDELIRLLRATGGRAEEPPAAAYAAA
jgi:ATP-binding cassette subfamily B protein